MLIKDAKVLVRAGGCKWAAEDLDVRIESGLIKEAGKGLLPAHGEKVIRGAGKWVLPGFVQAHVHLSQVLFRSLADDLSLQRWLECRILPLEAAHDEETLYDSVRLGCAEMLLGGTTSVLDLAGANRVDASFFALKESGIRAASGKVLMDRGNVPDALKGTADSILRDVEDLAGRWNRAEGGRLEYAVIPRFIPTCSRELFVRCAEIGRRLGAILHTHSSENEAEVAQVEKMEGQKPIHFLESVGWVGGDVSLAHCVHLDQEEEEVLLRTGTTVVHCPSANLKLASGVAPVRRYRQKGIAVALGTDGAPCNNTHSILQEMRMAGLLGKVFPHPEPEGLDAGEVLWMATEGGARAMGKEGEIGVIKAGARADLIVVDPDRLSMLPACGSEPASRLVYSADGTCIDTVIVNGKVVVEGGSLLVMDAGEVKRRAEKSRKRLLERAGLL